MGVIYSARDYGPIWLALGQTQTSKIEIYRDGAQVAPSAGSYTLRDPNGKAVVSAALVSVDSSAAQYTVPALLLSDTQHLGEGWQELWVLTIAGVQHTFQRPAALVRSALHPVVTDADLVELYSDLSSIRAASETSYQRYIDAAWKGLIGKLYGLGHWPYLILDPWSLRETHLHRTLELIWRDYGSTAGEGSSYLALANDHAKQAHFAFKAVSFRYDSDLTGLLVDNERRTGHRPIYTARPADSFEWDL